MIMQRVCGYARSGLSRPGVRSSRLTIALATGIACFSWARALPAYGAEAASDVLEEVVVTAQKRVQKAQDVGITLNAFSGDKLAELGAVDVPDIAKLTPGVGVSGSFAGQNVMFSIRGITQQDFQAHAESPVAVYIDEGYLAANNVSGIGLLDVERVEVLKGPQGTLFGRNATGGLVSITTRKPTKDFSATASVSFGSYSSVGAQAAIGGPLSDRVQARLAVAYDKNDGWVENINPNGGDLGGKKTKSARLHVAVQPTDSLDLLFTGYFSDTDQSWGPYMVMSTRSVVQNGMPNAIIVNEPTQFAGTDPFTGQPYVPQPASDAEHLRVDANHAQSSGSYNKIGGGTFRLNYDLGAGGQITAITDYKKLRYYLALDDDATSQTYFDTNTWAKIENWSQELRYFRDFGGTRLTAGGYYLHIDASETDLQRPFFLGVQVSSPFRLKTNSYSGFVQAEHSLTDKVTLVGGFRATKEEKNFSYDGNVQDFDGNFLVDARSYRGSLSGWLYSGKAQIEYRPLKDVLLFAGYSRGTKAGSFNAPFAGGATPPDAEIQYKPEKLDSYELGAKTTILDGHATLNGSVFYYDYKDYQAFKFVNFSTVVTNNPATIKGVEFDFNVRPVAGLEFMVGVSMLDAKVKDVALSNSLASAVATRMPPYTSKFTGFASARYEIPVPFGKLSVQADVSHVGKSYISLTNFDATERDPYTLVGARLAWQSLDSKWEVAAFGRNLTDERYKTVGFEASDFGGWTQIGYGEPRWFGASLSYRY